MHYNLFKTLWRFQIAIRRFDTKSQVRVRFAPSPTGYLHIGGLRTALYNYLFARLHNGYFILRFEDTDQTRIVHGAMEQLHDDLLWSGIIPDEDPIRGGPYGPYIQSKRIELYNEQVKILLDNGSAYKCFCSEHRLKMLKRTALKARQVPKYDNRCRHLNNDEIKEKLRKNEIYCIRFKLIPTLEPFNDLIYGNIMYNVFQNEGDPIILKSDGYPTYHFANVIDDHFMKISHVLRGVEWQMSTPKHLLIYKAFGWTPPQFAHLPLIINTNGTKLSKRQDDIRVDKYRKEGIFPLALVNYITSAGGGFTRNQGVSQCYSYQDLIKQFDIKKININSCKLNSDKLLEFNRLELFNLVNNEKNNKFLVERITKLLKEAFPDRLIDGSLKLDPTYIITILRWAHNRIFKLSDLVTNDLKFLWIEPTVRKDSKNLKYLEIIDILSMKLRSIDEDKFCKDSLKILLKDFASKNNLSFVDLMKTLRSLLSDLKDGPGVVEIMAILGRDETLNRLKRNTT